MKKIKIKKIENKKTDKTIFRFFCLYINMTNNYYKKNKEKLQKEARERYQIPSQEEKEKKRQYGYKWYKNLLEDEYKIFFSRIQEIKTIWV